jgi:hypothetical protein
MPVDTQLLLGAALGATAAALLCAARPAAAGTAAMAPSTSGERPAAPAATAGPGRLRGKVAVVTGAGAGIGRAIAGRRGDGAVILHGYLRSFVEISYIKRQWDEAEFLALERFAAEGASVVVADFNAENGNATATQIVAAGGVAVFQFTDCTREVDIEALMARAVSEYGRLDVLVNNAVRFVFGHLRGEGNGSKTGTDRDVTDADWSTTGAPRPYTENSWRALTHRLCAAGRRCGGRTCWATCAL